VNSSARLSLGLVLVASACSLGCEIIVSAHGAVYEWLNARPTEKSIIIPAQQVPDRYAVRPLPSAAVHLAIPQGKRAAPLLLSESSDVSGQFEVTCLTGYPDIRVLLRVEKTGYDAADFIFDPTAFGYHNDRLVVLLKPSQPTGPSHATGATVEADVEAVGEE
jgi:hypothetical protein